MHESILPAFLHGGWCFSVLIFLIILLSWVVGVSIEGPFEPPMMACEKPFGSSRKLTKNKLINVYPEKVHKFEIPKKYKKLNIM
jgi:hypothetical protein